MKLAARCFILLTLAARMAITLHAQAGAVFVGRVVADTSMRPIAGAEVMLQELSRTTVADEKGAFRISAIRPGTYLVVARRIGYARFESRVEFLEAQTVERAIVLPRLTTLDSVRVVGEVHVPLSFLEHRAIGLGHFMTRADLELQGDHRIANMLAMVPGVAILHGRTNQGWILSKRSPPRLRKGGGGMGDDFYSPSNFEKASGVVAGCYARVYLDNTLLNSSTPAEPVDVNEYFSGGIEAIEYYAGPSQTPSRYSRLNSTCGVLVLHRRRGP